MTRLFKAETWDPAWSHLPPWAQQKLDGHRLMVSKDNHGVVRAMTTSFINIWPKLEWMEQYHERIERFLKIGEQIDGELVIDGGTSEDVKRAIANRDSSLYFSPFACTRWPDDYPIGFLTQELNKFGFTCPGCQSTAHPECTMDWLIGHAKERNWEGWVLKDGNYANWYKLKLERTIDLRIMGINPGKDKYEGMIGSFILYTDCCCHVSNCAGMPDEVRALSEAEVLNRVVEVKYQRVGRNGKLLLPRMLRFRDDKLSSTCSLDQDPALARHWRK